MSISEVHTASIIKAMMEAVVCTPLKCVRKCKLLNKDLASGAYFVTSLVRTVFKSFHIHTSK
jgi:hypothetical protein